MDVVTRLDGVDEDTSEACCGAMFLVIIRTLKQDGTKEVSSGLNRRKVG